MTGNDIRDLIFSSLGYCDGETVMKEWYGYDLSWDEARELFFNEPWELAREILGWDE